MATFQELADRVRAELIDVPQRTDQLVDSFVNQAIRKLQYRHDWSVCKVSTGVLTTVKHQRFLAAVPADFLRFRKEQPYVIDNHGNVYYLGASVNEVPQAEREFGGIAGGEFNPAEIDGPPTIVVVSEPTDVNNTREFHIYPLPDGLSLYTTAPAGEYRINIPYVRLLPALSGAQSNWFTNNAEEYITYQAASVGFYFNEDEQRGQIWLQRAANEVQDILDRDKSESWAGTGTLHVSFDALGPKVPLGDEGYIRGYYR